MVGALGMSPSGTLLSLQAVREANIDFDSRASIEAADHLLRSLERECLARLRLMKPALDEITQRLLDEETVPGEDVLAAIARLPQPSQDAQISVLIGPALEAIDRVAASAMNGEGLQLTPLGKDGDDEGPGMV